MTDRRWIINTVNLGWLLFLRDFRYRFRQAYLGYLWAFVRPVLIALPVIIVGSHFELAKNSPLKVHYAVFAFTGIILWQILWDAIIFPQWMMRRTRGILKKIRFQYWSVVVAGCFYVLFNLAIYVMLILTVFVLFDVEVGWSVLAGFVTLGLLIICGLAVGITIAPITLVYLDIRYGLPVISSALLWTVPAIYATPPEGTLSVLNRWNPLTPLIEVPRTLLVSGMSGKEWLFVLSFGMFFLLFLWSLKFYRETMPKVIEQII